MRMRLLALLMLLLSTPVCAQTVVSSSGAVSTVNISDPPADPSSSATVTNRLVTPPNVVAPGLAAAGVETCLGSASGGLSLMGGGFTFGSTKVDEGCTLRLLARQLFAFGFRKAAVALMCQDEHVFVAMDEVGTPCPPPRGFAPSEPLALMPSSYANADPLPPLVDEADVKSFTHEEAALFARASAQE